MELFLSLVKPQLRLQLVELSDPYGPTVTDAALQVSVCVAPRVCVALKRLPSYRFPHFLFAGS